MNPRLDGGSVVVGSGGDRWNHRGSRTAVTAAAGDDSGDLRSRRWQQKWTGAGSARSNPVNSRNRPQNHVQGTKTSRIDHLVVSSGATHANQAHKGITARLTLSSFTSWTREWTLGLITIKPVNNNNNNNNNNNYTKM
jgi:hypothetical protein